MKKSDIVVVLGMLTVFAYIGYREYLMSKFMRDTEYKVNTIQKKLAKFYNDQAVTPAGEIPHHTHPHHEIIGAPVTTTTGDTSKVPSKIANAKISGYYCSTDSFITLFKKDNTMLGWTSKDNSISGTKNKKPYATGKYIVAGGSIKTKYKDIHGETLTLLFSINDVDEFEDNIVTTLLDEDKIVFSKLNCKK